MRPRSVADVAVLHPPAPAVTVLIADGQALVRAGFRVLLEAADPITVVGEAASGEEAITERDVGDKGTDRVERRLAADLLLAPHVHL